MYATIPTLCSPPRKKKVLGDLSNSNKENCLVGKRINNGDQLNTGINFTVQGKALGDVTNIMAHKEQEEDYESNNKKRSRDISCHKVPRGCKGSELDINYMKCEEVCHAGFSLLHYIHIVCVRNKFLTLCLAGSTPTRCNFTIDYSRL